MLSVAQFATMHENPVLRKTRNKLDQRIFSPREVWRSVYKDFVGSFLWRIWWAHFYFFMKLKFRLWSEKHIFRKIDSNLTVSPIELIETAIELSISSLSSEHINKIQNFRKIFTEKRGGGTLKEGRYMKYMPISSSLNPKNRLLQNGTRFSVKLSLTYYSPWSNGWCLLR